MKKTKPDNEGMKIKKLRNKENEGNPIPKLLCVLGVNLCLLGG